MGLVGSLILIIIPSALSDRHGELRAVALSERTWLLRWYPWQHRWA
jgi:hypothetical protein